MTDRHPRRPAADRARKRAIRAQAVKAGVAYSVAARQLTTAPLAPGEMLASHGRTIYPAGGDPHREWLIDCRARRPFDERVMDTRRAAILPGGRARQLTERFPPTRGRDRTAVGPLYHGAGREDALAMLYVVVLHEAPGLVPAVGDLAWIAELGEETALDTACGELDRTARRLLDGERSGLWPRIEAALAAGAGGGDWLIRQEAIGLTASYHSMMTPSVAFDGEPEVTGPPLEGARHILDAVLIVSDDGHAPGTRVRLLGYPYQGRIATIVGAQWGASGPPIGYEIRLDGTRTVLPAGPDDLVVLANQEGPAVVGSR